MSNQIEVKATETSATITVLDDERAKRHDALAAKTFEDLSDRAMAVYVFATDGVQQTLSELANALREAASRGADLRVDHDREQQKRDAIAFWRATAAHLDIVCNAVGIVPVSGETLKAEMAEMLINGLNLWLQSPIETREPMASMMVERAANLAQAYQGRILPEQK